MTITDKPNITGGHGGRSFEEHGAGVGIMAEQMMQETAGKAIPAGYQQTEVAGPTHDRYLHKLIKSRSVEWLQARF